MGIVESMCHANVAGVGSALVTASMAGTEIVCAPSARPVSDQGLTTAVYAPPSTLASKVPTSVAVSVNVAAGEVDLALVVVATVVSGAWVSIVQRKIAGVGSVLPAASRARKFTVNSPSCWSSSAKSPGTWV